MSPTRTTARRAWAGVAAGALLFGLGLAAAPAATAGDGDGNGDGNGENPASAVLPGNIDPNAKGSITIHKRQSPASSTNHPTGLENPTEIKNPAVSGVTFELRKLNVDLTKPAVWAGFEEDGLFTEPAPESSEDEDPLPPSPYSWDPTFNTTGVMTLGPTEADGIVKTGKVLPVGVYLVTEAEVPDDVTAGPSFWVTVPTTHPTDGTWNYDVVVFPKNNVTTGGQKAVIDGTDAYGPRDYVTWQITANIPSVALSSFVIEDHLNSALIYKGTPTVTVMWGDGEDDRTKLEPSSDSDDLWSVDEPGAGTNGGTVTLTFAKKGLEKIELLRHAHDGAKLVFSFDTEVTESGVIPNTANVLVNDADGFVDSTDGKDEVDEPLSYPTNEVVTKWGQIQVTKRSAHERGKLLDGAVFKLYASRNAELSADALKLADDDFVGTLPDETRYLETLTTAGGGVITSSVLRLSDFADDVGSTALTHWYYYLVEVAPPAGYALNDTPVELVELTSELATEPAEEDRVAWTKYVEVTNAQIDNSVTLPSTGGQGTLLLTVGGLLILGSAGVLVVRSRRRVES